MAQAVQSPFTREEATEYTTSMSYHMGVANAAYGIDQQVAICHSFNVYRGWWSDLDWYRVTGQIRPAARDFGELTMLIVTEVSEAFEGVRTSSVSDKIPEFSAAEEELADVLIRIFDLAGAMKLRLGAAYAAKFAYNQTREDHMLENRVKKGGKKF